MLRAVPRGGMGVTTPECPGRACSQAIGIRSRVVPYAAFFLCRHAMFLVTFRDDAKSRRQAYGAFYYSYDNIMVGVDRSGSKSGPFSPYP